MYVGSDISHLALQIAKSLSAGKHRDKLKSISLITILQPTILPKSF